VQAQQAGAHSFQQAEEERISSRFGDEAVTVLGTVPQLLRGSCWEPAAAGEQRCWAGSWYGRRDVTACTCCVQRVPCDGQSFQQQQQPGMFAECVDMNPYVDPLVLACPSSYCQTPEQCSSRQHLAGCSCLLCLHAYLLNPNYMTHSDVSESCSISIPWSSVCLSATLVCSPLVRSFLALH
jgi:hypothetical protein